VVCSRAYRCGLQLLARFCRLLHCQLIAQQGQQPVLRLGLLLFLLLVMMSQRACASIAPKLGLGLRLLAHAVGSQDLPGPRRHQQPLSRLLLRLLRLLCTPAKGRQRQ